MPTEAVEDARGHKVEREAVLDGALVGGQLHNLWWPHNHRARCCHAPVPRQILCLVINGVVAGDSRVHVRLNHNRVCELAIVLIKGAKAGKRLVRGEVAQKVEHNHGVKENEHLRRALVHDRQEALRCNAVRLPRVVRHLVRDEVRGVQGRARVHQ